MKQLITFNTAKLAKQKGYDQLENHFYYDDGTLDNGDGDCEFICLNHNLYERHYSAPTTQDLARWLKINENCNEEQIVLILNETPDNPQSLRLTNLTDKPLTLRKNERAIRKF